MKKILLFCLSLQSFCAIAQDTHFTQYYATPSFLNPAMIGAFDGRYRLSGVYRNQWSSFLSTPFQSVGAMLDLRMPIGKGQEESYLGAGIDLYSDKLGGKSYASTNSMALSAAYHKPLDMWGNNYISAGLRVSFAQRSVNYEGLSFQDQFNGLDGYTIASAEVLPRNSVSYADLATGVFWSTNLEKRNQFHAGIGVYHFNAPNVALYTNDPKALAVRTSILAGGQVELAPRIDLMPRLVVSVQGGNFESNIGTNLRLGLDDYNDSSLFFGAWARPVGDVTGGVALDAVVLMTGLQLGEFRVGASYDSNLSGLLPVSKSVGAFELTMQYIGNYGGEKVVCPTF
jgi:type IX secretion system PorP/SprF family membrane protein